MKKVLAFLATEKGYRALCGALEHNYGERIGCVVSFRESDVLQSFDQPIKALCARNSIPFLDWKEAKGQIEAIVKRYGITGAIAISWKYLLPLALNDVLQDKLIIFHDSLLPKYRGFAPTPTAILCGESTIGMTAFFAAELLDRGDIILQKELTIAKDEYIQQIIGKQAELYAQAFIEILQMMEQNSIVGRPQDETQATYSIWRSPEDCRIDWSRSSEEIYNLIRAVSTPYPGAYTFMNDEKIIITKARIAEDIQFAKNDYGKIWTIMNNHPVVICGEGMLYIECAVDSQERQIRFDRIRTRLK